jgi:hypothetical protein
MKAGNNFGESVSKRVAATRKELGEDVAALGRKLRIHAKSLTASFYFGYWSRKAKILHYLRFSFVVILIASAGLLIVEALLEYAGKEWVAEGIAATGRTRTLRGGFLLAVAFLAWHNLHELRKPEYEYRFVRRLRELLFIGRMSSAFTGPSLIEILEAMYQVFEHRGVAHACIALPHGEEMSIRRDHVHPPAPGEAFYRPFKVGEGVAGHVYEDGLVRYVPRIYFPLGTDRLRFKSVGWELIRMMPFPHAISYSREKNAGTDWASRSTRLLEELPDWGCVQMPDPDDACCFRAFLSVPLDLRWEENGSSPVKQQGSSSSGEAKEERRCLGVLNFDFDRVDPLGKPEIEMALILGLALADEIERNPNLLVPVGISKSGVEDASRQEQPGL